MVCVDPVSCHQDAFCLFDGRAASKGALQVVELGKEGKSPVQIAVALGVSRPTLLAWAEQYPEFSTALLRAKECEQDWWENMGQTNLGTREFNSAVWSKSMSARFRQDYTDTSKHEHSGSNGNPIKIIITSLENEF